MTDEQLDRLIREADPYPPGVVARLDGSEHHLLEEIMTVPVAEAAAEPRRPRHRAFRRTAVALAAAAAVVGVLAVSFRLSDPPLDEPEVPPVAAGSVSAGSGMVHAAAVLKAAEANPRLLIDEPGWTVEDVYGFAEESGVISVVNGGRTLKMSWYPAKEYRGYYRDRLSVSAPEGTTVDGWAGDVFTYGVNDFAVMLRPRGDVFVELRTGGAWNRGSFDQMLTHVKRVDVRTWLAALPPSIVTPDRAAAAATKVLADIPLPPGFDVGVFDGLGANDPYQFGAGVTGKIGCAWIAEWFRAKKAGDAAAQRRAAAAMGGSRDWQVLHDMNAAGDWPEVFWEIGDQVADGGPRRGYATAIGCDA